MTMALSTSINKKKHTFTVIAIVASVNFYFFKPLLVKEPLCDKTEYHDFTL